MTNEGNGAAAPLGERLAAAEARLAMGDADGAIGLLRAAVAAHPDSLEALLALAATCRRVGKPSIAAEALRAYLAEEPECTAALDELGVAYTNLYRGEEAAATFARLLELDPKHASGWCNLGWLRLRETRLEDADEALSRAVRLDPDHALTHERRCWLLRRLGRLDEAVAAGREAVRLGGGQDSCNYLAFALLAHDQPEEAVAVCEAGLRRFPCNIGGMTHYGNALAAAGQRDKAAWLMDFQRLVLSVRIGGADGYPSLAAFNDALVRAVLESPSRPMDPMQTPNLMLAPPPPVQTLAAVADRAVRSYLKALPDDPAHPYLARRPRHWSFDLWGTRMEQMERIEHHLHHQGWVSGVYYARVPGFVGTPSAGIHGCLEFARFQRYGSRPMQSEFMVLPPEEGRLVLFPSYLPHRVVDFPKSALRVSLAFNAMPAEWGFFQTER